MTVSEKTRIAWVDYTKGICIIAIVALLATRYVQGLADEVGWTQSLNDFGHPFRTPALFVAAGLFLANVINRPWRDYLDGKLIYFGYFFVLWTTLYFVAGVFDGEFDPARPLWLHYLDWYVAPFKQLWFIEMLPIFFIVTRFLRPVPWYLMLAGAALLQIWSPESEFRQVERFCERYVYFYAGYVFAPFVFELARRAVKARGQALLAIGACSVLNIALVRAGVDEEPGFSLVLGFVGAGCVVAASSLMSGSKWMDWLRYTGEHSIVIFVSCYGLIVVTARAVDALGLEGDIGWQTSIVTALTVGCGLFLQWALRRSPFKYLFERPRWLSLKKPSAKSGESGLALKHTS